MVVTAGIGSDHTDLQAAIERGVTVAEVTYCNSISVAEHVVMMILALPFAHLQRRTGGIGSRIFVGIMLGLGFHLANRLTGYLGLIYEWPVPVSALLPGVLFLLLALAMISLLERR